MKKENKKPVFSEKSMTLEDILRGMYSRSAGKIVDVITVKQLAYGDSFGQAHQIMNILYPGGVNTGQMHDALTIIRIIDKFFRIANQKDAFGESPWKDIAGYALLKFCREDHKSILDPQHCPECGLPQEKDDA